MNNEPVAWMTENGTIFDELPLIAGGLIPLYTHPAKTLTDDSLVNFKPVWQEKPELTLTDEEITDIAKEYIHQRLEGERFGYVDFARAILKKAQEK